MVPHTDQGREAEVQAVTECLALPDSSLGDLIAGIEAIAARRGVSPILLWLTVSQLGVFNASMATTPLPGDV